MDFVAVMLFTQQVFHLECLLFQIKSQIWHFTGAILSEKSCQKQGVWKKYKKEGWP